MLHTTEKAAAQAFIAQQRLEVDQLKQRVARLEISIRANEELLTYLEELGAPSPASALRPGSQVERAYRVLQEAQTPLHISDILIGMGAEDTPTARHSLVGALSRYVRKKQVFVRAARGTFGLLDETPVAPAADEGVQEETERALE